MVETQFKKIIKRIRTDNGSEFKSSYMLGFYKEHVILLETSCSYTPQKMWLLKENIRIYWKFLGNFDFKPLFESSFGVIVY